MKTVEAPQDCVEHAYFILGYLILKSCEVIPNVFSGIWKEGRYPMEVLLQSNHSNFLRHSSNQPQISVKAKTMKNLGKKHIQSANTWLSVKQYPKQVQKIEIMILY